MTPPKIGGGQLQSEIWRALQELQASVSGGGEHEHEIGEVTGLQAALDAKAATHDHPYDPEGTAAQALLDAYAADFSGDYNDLTNKPSLFSGSYADLTNKPTLGGAASKEVGTAAGTVAAGDHTHAGGGSALDAWPVGSVYIAVDSTSPATRFGGGTWAAFGAGRMLIGINGSDADFDTAEETGGAKTSNAVVNHTHGVTVDDPGHVHVENLNSATTGGLRGATPDTSTNTSTASGYSTASATTGITATTANPAGGVASHSIMNPYIVVYMWKRTA